MKKYIFTLLFPLLFLTGCGLDKALTQPGENFLQLIKDNNIDMAYLTTANEFQDATTLEGLSYMIDNYNLRNYKTIDWTEAESDGATGRLVGNISFEDGKTLTLTARIINKNDAWMIQSLQFNNPNLAQEKNLPTSPDQFVTLINETMRLFVTDLQKKSFNDTYNALSDLWKSQTDLQTFTEAFQKFLDLQGKDFSFVMNTNPELLNPPQVQPTEDNNVIMVLQGKYTSPTEESLLFDLRYIQENNQWKLAGINLGLQEASEATTQ